MRRNTLKFCKFETLYIKQWRVFRHYFIAMLNKYMYLTTNAFDLQENPRETFFEICISLRDYFAIKKNLKLFEYLFIFENFEKKQNWRVSSRVSCTKRARSAPRTESTEKARELCTEILNENLYHLKKSIRKIKCVLLNSVNSSKWFSVLHMWAWQQYNFLNCIHRVLSRKTKNLHKHRKVNLYQWSYVIYTEIIFKNASLQFHWLNFQNNVLKDIYSQLYYVYIFVKRPLQNSKIAATWCYRWYPYIYVSPVASRITCFVSCVT